MSSMSLPRIFFAGRGQANVPTGNNQLPPPALIDIPSCELVPLPPDDPLPPTPENDRRVRDWLMRLAPGGHLRGRWNYFGDNSFTFDGVCVTGVQTARGEVSKSDPVVGLEVGLHGHDGTAPVTIDVDPLSDFASWVIAHRLTLGTSGDECSLFAEGLSYGSMRWVNTTRNLFFDGEGAEGAFVQFVVTRDDPDWNPGQLDWNPGRSGALAAMRDAAKHADGLVVTCVFYNFDLNLESPAEMAKRFARGDFVTNPAIGPMVGSLGLWRRGEPTQVPAGRYLGPARELKAHSKTFRLGPAILEVGAADRRADRPGDRPASVTLNLMNTFPERSADGGKVDLGDVYLAWRRNAGDDAILIHAEPLDYRRDAYLATSGIVDVPNDSGLGEKALRGGQFLLVRGEEREPLAVETEVVVTTDDWATYLDEGETQEILLQVFERGRPARGVEVAIHQYRLRDQGAYRVGSEQADPPVRRAVEVERARVTTDGNGQAWLRVTAIAPGTAMLCYTVGDAQAPPSPWTPAEMDFYSHVRVMPDDDLSGVEATWDNVYREVLRYYFLVYPAMSLRIPFDDETAVRNAAPRIADRVQKDFLETTYMPITRDLSKGKRDFLIRWCRCQGSRAAPSRGPAMKR